MRKAPFIAVAALALISAQASAQASNPQAAASTEARPFGFRAGATLSSLSSYGIERTDNNGIYRVRRAPESHPDFDGFTLVISPSHGLCKVVASSRTVETSAYGDRLKNLYERIRDALHAKYGEGEEFDYLRSGSIWDEPRDWMMGLLREERTLASYWGRDSGTLPGNLQAIALKAVALSPSSGFLLLNYEFSTFAACKEELDRATRNPL
ncbi:MAG TPA: hypothetical protein VF746_31570 [Longimicrobium sp.]|jgi:hypothetical protein